MSPELWSTLLTCCCVIKGGRGCRLVSLIDWLTGGLPLVDIAHHARNKLASTTAATATTATVRSSLDNRLTAATATAATAGGRRSNGSSICSVGM